MTATERAIDLTRIAARAADERLGFDQVALDVSDTLPLTDVFLIVSARNERMVDAIADEVEQKLAQAGQKALRREGRELRRWLLLDFGDIVVHVFHEEDREYYALERLWNDAPVIDLELPEHDGDREGANDEPRAFRSEL